MRTRSLLGTLLLPIIFSTPVVFAGQIDYTFTVSNVEQIATRVTCPPAGGDCVDEELVITTPAYPGPVDINGSFTVDHDVPGEFSSPYGQDPQTASVGFPAFPYQTSPLTNYQLTVNGSLFTQERSILAFHDEAVDVPPEWWGETSPQDSIITLCIKVINLCTTPDIFTINYDGIPLISHQAALIFREGEETGFNFFPDAALADDLSQQYSSATLPPVFPPNGAEKQVFRMTFRSPDLNGTFIQYVLEGTLNVTALNGPPAPAPEAHEIAYQLTVATQTLQELDKRPGAPGEYVDLPISIPVFDETSDVRGGFLYDPTAPVDIFQSQFLCGAESTITCLGAAPQNSVLITNQWLELLGQNGQLTSYLFPSIIQYINDTFPGDEFNEPVPEDTYIFFIGGNWTGIQFTHDNVTYEPVSTNFTITEGPDGQDFFPAPPVESFPDTLPPKGSAQQVLSISFRSVAGLPPDVTRFYNISGPLEIGPLPTPITIDVDPWSEANEVLTNSDNPIPVAVFSSSTVNGDAVDLDTGKIDPATLKLGIGEAPNVAFPWPLDYNGDYNTDVAYAFKTQASGIFCEDTEVTLTGETYSGEKFEGTGSINASDCETGFCHPL